MGRHREFDEDAVLDAVMMLFWRQGYRHTSTRDLAKETGLAEARLYNAFGDKRQLFLLALERYRARGLRFARAIVEGDDPLGAIQGYVLRTAKNLAGQDDLRGCLITNTMIELAPHDEEIRQQLKASFEVRTALLRKALSAAKAKGQLHKDADIKALSGYLVQILEGLRVIAKTKPGEQTLVNTARFALSLVPAGGQKPRKKRAVRVRAKTKAHV